MKGFRGDGPLHLAASKWPIEFVELLLKRKANGRSQLHKYKLILKVNAMNEVGQTPVYQASRAGNLEVVKFLVEKGKADIFINSKESASPLYVAAGLKVYIISYKIEYGHSAVVRYLVTECKADVEAKLHTGATPVVIASQKVINKFTLGIYVVGTLRYRPILGRRSWS